MWAPVENSMHCSRSPQNSPNQFYGWNIIRFDSAQVFYYYYRAKKNFFTEINPASLPRKCKWTISTSWTLESIWVFLGCWRVFCFPAGKLDWLELGLGSAADTNFDDHSASFWLRTSSLSVTKDTIRVSSCSNKCKNLMTKQNVLKIEIFGVMCEELKQILLNRIFVCWANSYQWKGYKTYHPQLQSLLVSSCPPSWLSLCSLLYIGSFYLKSAL